MRYDFDTIINRKDTNSVKWDFYDCEVPMWVADMDFKVATEIKDALNSKVNEGIYGYTLIPDEWYDAYINWWKKYSVVHKKEWLKFTNSVMPAISSLIREFTEENDRVLIQTPVYHVFFYVIEDNNRIVEENKLIYDGENYSIDFNDLEEKFKDPKVKLMLLCNPHNPIGKIWTKDELVKIGELADKYNVIVISDEIHCDLTNPGLFYTPYISASNKTRNNSITTLSPSKSFNIAGIKTAAVSIPNEKIREKAFNHIQIEGLSDPNLFACSAAIEAYNHGEDWLNQLRDYIYNNKLFLDKYLKEEIPDLKLVPSEATYLLWIDCSKLNIKSKEFNDFLLEKTKVVFSPGYEFGENGDQFIRINVACPRKLLEDGLKRLKKGVELYKEEFNI
ncbi:MAG: MalY/PatB family protein [Methanobrevibacter sp.]